MASTAAPVFGMDMDLDDIPGPQKRRSAGGGGRRPRGGGRAGGNAGGRTQHLTQSGGPRGGAGRGGGRRDRDRDDQSRGGGRGAYGSGYQRTIYRERDTYERRRPEPAAFVTAKNRTETMIIVQNLAPHVTTEDIKEIFSSKGALRKAFVNYDDKGVSRGTAEVVYESAKHADDAYAAYQGLKVDSVPLKLVLLKGDDSGFSGADPRPPPARRVRPMDDDADYDRPRRGGPRGAANGSGRDYGGRGGGLGRSRHEASRNQLLRLDGDEDDDASNAKDDVFGQSKAEVFGSALRGNGSAPKGRGGRREATARSKIEPTDLDAMMDKYHQSAASTPADDDAAGDDVDNGDE